MMRFYISILFLLLQNTFFAQNDTSLLLPPVVLKDTQIIRFKPDAGIQQFQTANRYAENLEDIPFTTYVITSAEILRNGYVTLADALKNVPGIRVSQPGSAINGETFMMRGLLGNYYTKILINDVPVRPSAMQGVSIAAQLPIRQAERIEILYGAASSIYGFDACAGVINIILKESERPLYTQADLSFGRYGYNSIDLMFGGKIGQDKKIFRFTIYGSSTVRDETDVYYDNNLYNYAHYVSADQNLDSIRRLPNYAESTVEVDTFKFARKSKLPSESRLFGAKFTWRGIAFTYNRMERKDHAALGLNPLAASYASNGTLFSERTQMFAASFRARIRKIQTYNNFSGVFYKVDETSSNKSITDYLLYGYERYGFDSTQSMLSRDYFLNKIITENYKSEKYRYARGSNLKHDLRTTFQIKRRLSLDLGWQFSILTGTPFVNRLQQPYSLRDSTQYLYTDIAAEITAFSQLNWTGKKLSIKVGSAGNINYFLNYIRTPRFAALYKINKKIALYGNYVKGVRFINFATKNNGFSAQRGFINSYSPFTDSTEIVKNIELGARYSINKRQINISAFYQNAYRLLSDGQIKMSPDYGTSIGLSRSPGLSMIYTGIQVNMTNQAISFDSDMQFNGKRLLISMFNDVSAQYAKGKEWFGLGIPPSNNIRNQPQWTLQMRSTFRINRFETIVRIYNQSSWVSGAVAYKDQYQRDKALLKNKGFTTWDWMNRFYMSDHFIVYFQFQNLWNRHYAGIDATGTPDDLLYNPQQGRLFRLGINYNMN
jgi:outer membrane receptor protein involved in Fe transport